MGGLDIRDCEEIRSALLRLRQLADDAGDELVLIHLDRALTAVNVRCRCLVGDGGSGEFLCPEEE
jgi:hypothetical protein